MSYDGVSAHCLIYAAFSEVLQTKAVRIKDSLYEKEPVQSLQRLPLHSKYKLKAIHKNKNLKN